MPEKDFPGAEEVFPLSHWLLEQMGFSEPVAGGSGGDKKLFMYSIG